MRLADKLNIERNTYNADGYGGKTKSDSITFTISAKFQVKNNDMKSKSNGYGYYRILSFFTDSKSLLQGDIIKQNGVSYKLESVIPYGFLFSFCTAYEV